MEVDSSSNSFTPPPPILPKQTTNQTMHAHNTPPKDLFSDTIYEQTFDKTPKLSSANWSEEMEETDEQSHDQKAPEKFVNIITAPTRF
jgi:hypothetical protein